MQILQILTAEAYTGLRRRYKFEKSKVVDYESRMSELKKQYRNLKKLEALTRNPAGVVDIIFQYSERAEPEQESRVKTEKSHKKEH